MFRIIVSSLLNISWICTIVSVSADPDFSTIGSDLKLSRDGRFHLRGSSEYTRLTQRWQYWEAPDVAAVVEVATESDVAASIQFANTHNIPFTAQSGGHGGISSLGMIKDGIQINMRRLNSFKLSKDGSYVTIGGGTKVKELSNFLWSHDKWTLNGVCECPGVTTVTLGGGHGLLQGRYGLASDQVISLNVVLANGTLITVSETQHEGLFWAMRGAGHNYGVVTSFDYRVYDIPKTEAGGKI